MATSSRNLLNSHADVFLLTAASPVRTDPAAFFFGHVWYLPHAPSPVRLLDTEQPEFWAIAREVRTAYG